MSSMNEWKATSAAALSKGITLLEASAGTGKTYNIASLVLRLVAEQDVAMGDVVVVTFTRAATAELRDRVRARLAGAVDVLEGRSAPSDDEVLTALKKANSPRALRNLRAAQESFDECQIATIHGFCQRMLQQNAFEARADFDLELVGEAASVREEVVDDWLSKHLYADEPARFDFLTRQCGITRDRLCSLAFTALRDADVEVVPRPSEATAQGWDAERDAFVGPWDRTWGKTLPALYEEAHAHGIFSNPKQRTYRRKMCEARVADVTAWLRQRPSLGEPLPKSTYWSAANVRSFLADGRTEPTNDALVALRRVLGYSAHAAACERSAFVAWVRTEFDRRMGERRAQSYQDLLRRLARVLTNAGDPGREALVHAIGSRFKAALIDEFQDTDALQWNIFRALFGDPDHWLYLIGDPKQAIYGFRGANVHVYLEAKKAAADRCFTMQTNFRSDARIVGALNAMMDRPGFFAEPGIDYVRVQAAPRKGQPETRIRFDRPASDPFTAPVQLRFVDARLAGATTASEPDKAIGKTKLNATLPARVADDIVEMLASGTTVYDAHDGVAPVDGFRPIGAGDVAVLTRTAAQGADVRDALVAAGVACVLHSEQSVFASEEALEVQRWLEALASPGRDPPARAAATTHLFGRQATLLARADAQDPEALRAWEQWLLRLAGWRARFDKEGFFRTFRHALRQDTVASAQAAGIPEDAATRLLRLPDGERRLTNTWHIAELLHTAETSDRLQLAGLLAWLRRERASATADSETMESRLERDDEAVAIMTMHKAKGLEFPVVFAPYLWDGHGPKKNAPLLLPREHAPAERVLDVWAGGNGDEAFERACRENQKEQLRILYVACTRARLRCVAYVGHVRELENSPLAAAMHGDSPDGGDRIAAGAARVHGATRAQLWKDLELIAAESGTPRNGGSPAIALTSCEAPEHRTWTQVDGDTESLEVRDFLRSGLDRTWRRHSYSSLAHDGVRKPAPVLEDVGLDRDADEAIGQGYLRKDPGVCLPTYAVPKDAPSVPLAPFPAGADTGTFLHALLENTDFQWAHPTVGGKAGSAALRELIDAQLPAHGLERARWSELLHSAMLEVLRTPLGCALEGVRLCDIPSAARLNELRFDFPIAGGTAYGTEPHCAPVPAEAVARALRARQRASGVGDEDATISATYLEKLPFFGDLAGFMTGSIDVVFRHAVAGKPRWFLADYKSNRLDPLHLGTVPIESFCRDGMRYAMETNNYYLQYHLYVLALHRTLRSRLGDRYSYDEDMGGVYYLFLRGMIGKNTPVERGRRHGCFYDKPPFEVIEALDRVFSGTAAADAGGTR